MRRVRDRQRLATRLVNYVRDHFRGRHSLARSYWVNGVLVGLIVTPVWFFGFARLRDSAVRNVFAWSVASFIPILAIGVWQWVGIWRAAGASLRRRRAWPAWLARLSVLYSAFITVREVNALGRTYAAADIEGAFQVRILGKPGEAELVGILKRGVADEVERFLAKHRSVTLLHLSSPGGLLNEGLRIAELVKERRLNVIVDDTCASACTFILLAGAERWARPEAHIGFHGARAPGTDEYVPSRALRSALREVGASEDFIARAESFRGADAWEPDVERLQKQHIVTRIAKPDEFTYSFHDYSRAAMEDSLAKIWVLGALRRMSPHRFDVLVGNYLEGPELGRTKQELTDEIVAATKYVMDEALCRTSPEALAARQTTLRAVGEATVTNAPHRCREALDGQFSLDILSKELAAEFEQRQRNVVESSLDRTRVPDDEKLLGAAREALSKRLAPATLEVLDDAGAETDPQKVCAALVDYHRSAADLDAPSIAAIARSETCAASAPGAKQH